MFVECTGDKRLTRNRGIPPRPSLSPVPLPAREKTSPHGKLRRLVFLHVLRLTGGLCGLRCSLSTAGAQDRPRRRSSGRLIGSSASREFSLRGVLRGPRTGPRPPVGVSEHTAPRNGLERESQRRPVTLGFAALSGPAGRCRFPGRRRAPQVCHLRSHAPAPLTRGRGVFGAGGSLRPPARCLFGDPA